ARGIDGSPPWVDAGSCASPLCSITFERMIDAIHRLASRRLPAGWILALACVGVVAPTRAADSARQSPGRPAATEKLLCQLRGVELAGTASCISADARHVAYRVQANGKQALLVDGRRGPLYDAVELPAFGPDARHLAFLARRGSRLLAVTDTGVVASYDSTT